MKIYFDSEFTGLKKDDDLISIGLICKPAEADSTKAIKFHSFYGVISDFDKSKCDDWVLQNVVNIIHDDELAPQKKSWTSQGSVEQTRVYGTFKTVSDSINKWIKQMYDIEKTNSEESGRVYIEFVSDVSSYDFVHLVDLITMHGSSLDLPTYIVPYCIDIMPNVKRLLPLCGCDDSWYHAFNDNRENMAHTIMKLSIKFNRQYEQDRYTSMVIRSKNLTETTQLLVDLWQYKVPKEHQNDVKELWENCIFDAVKHNALFDASIIYTIDILSDWVDTYFSK